MPCNWPIDTACLPDVPEDDESAQQTLGYAQDLAVDVLWALSARQFGACAEVYRPCPRPCADSYRRGGCGCNPTCRREGPGVIRLPGPVARVLYVEFGGVPIDTDTYAVEGDYLYRVGERAWPAQDLTRPLGQEGTWAVTYERGIDPPPHVARLVGLLTAEFYAACTGGKCRLPRRVQSVTRQGVSFQMADPTSILNEGKTGITEIDMWLSAVNPFRAASAPRVR